MSCQRRIRRYPLKQFFKMKRTLSTNASDENSSKSRKKNNQSPLDLLIEMIIENCNEKNEVTINKAFQIIVKDKDDIINAKCRDKVKN